MSTFITVGNAKQPFPRMLSMVAAMARRNVLSMPITIQYGNAAVPLVDCTLIPFLASSEYIKMMAEAHLIITHAGAGSIIHALSYGKTPIVVPRRKYFGEHIDDHQMEMAVEMASLNMVVIAQDENELHLAVKQHHGSISGLTRRPSGSLQLAIRSEFERIAAKIKIETNR